MRDEPSKARVTLLHPKVRQEVYNAIVTIECEHLPKNAKIRLVQGLRTIQEQNDLYAQGRTKPGKVITNARGGRSYHNYGLAIDFAIMYDKDKNGTFETLSWDHKFDMDKDGIADWKEIYSNFINLGWEWGGNFRTFVDLPHLQKRFGYTWQQLLDKYNRKDFISGTKYVNL